MPPELVLYCLHRFIFVYRALSAVKRNAKDTRNKAVRTCRSIKTNRTYEHRVLEVNFKYSLAILHAITWIRKMSERQKCCVTSALH